MPTIKESTKSVPSWGSFRNAKNPKETPHKKQQSLAAKSSLYSISSHSSAVTSHETVKVDDYNVPHEATNDEKIEGIISFLRKKCQSPSPRTKENTNTNQQFDLTSQLRLFRG